MTKISTTPQTSPTETIAATAADFAPFERAAQGKIAAAEAQRGSLKSIRYKTLGKIWMPGFVKKAKARSYFENTPKSLPNYVGELYPNRPDRTEALFGVMAYGVAEREVVLSLGNRLVELGEIAVKNSDGQTGKMLLNLTENPSGDSGEQTLVFARGQNPGVNDDDFVASLVGAIALPEAVALTRERLSEREERILAVYKVPAEISWDKKPHTVKLEAKVRLPKSGKKDFVSSLLKFLHLNNGRPAQHYPDAAATINLDEILFADPLSVRVTLDPGTPDHMMLTPDRFFGKKLVVLLSQTAGGFFERKYLQSFDPAKPSVAQLSSVGVTTPAIQTSLIADVHGAAVRKTEIGYDSAPYKTRYFEKAVILDSGETVFELARLEVVSATGEELMAVDFNTGSGRGLRDLGWQSDQVQRGRYKMSLKGEEGFSYGEFTVSPTERRPGFVPVWYAAIELSPAFPQDMRRKKVILHVVQDHKGIYTETQVVPLKYVHPPTQAIQEEREKPMWFLE